MTLNAEVLLLFKQKQTNKTLKQLAKVSGNNVWVVHSVNDFDNLSYSYELGV